MTASQPDLLELAKQGDARAIAALLSRSLESKGIAVKVFLRDKCLSIFLEASQTPNQQLLTSAVHKGLTSLGITSIKTVKLYGRQKGSDLPDWQQQFILKTYVEIESAQITVIQPRTSTIQPTSPVRSAISYPAKAQTQNNRLVLIATASVATVFLLGIVSVGGWLFLTRSAQAKAVAQAKGLVNGVSTVETHSDLDALKTDEKQLQDNQKKLQDAITLLGGAPDLPAFSLTTIASERLEAKTQLASVEQSIQDVEQKIKRLEQLLPKVQEAVDKFSAMHSGLNVGMNYRDYGQQVRELKVVLDRFERQSGANEHPAYQELAAAFKEYDLALDVWEYYIDSDETHNFFPSSSQYGKLLTSEYGVNVREIGGEDYIYLNNALSAIWRQAGKHVKATQK
jgi:hypothetical protein